MDTCIAIIMYCLRLFLLFTGKQHCLHLKKIRGTYLQRISVFMQNLKFGGVVVLAVQLFNKIKKKKSKNMFHCISQMLCRNTFIFVEFIPFCMFLTLMSLEMKITVKVKSEFSLSMGLMVINHNNPYNYTQTQGCRIGAMTPFTAPGNASGRQCFFLRHYNYIHVL